MTEKTNPLLIEVPMPIETPRLRLEVARGGFGAQVIEAVNASLDTLRPWMSWVHKPEDMTLEAREAWLRDAEASFIRRENLFMMAFERDSNTFIGNTGFHDIKWDMRSMSIGYWVRGDYQGRGYATEMTIGLLHYAFNALGADRVQVAHHAGNAASRRVIEKARFVYEGTLRNDDRDHQTGELSDSRVYGHIDVRDVPQLDVKW